MNKKSVCVFIPSLMGGGAEKVAVNLVNQFVENEVNVQLVVAKNYGKFWDLLSPKVKVVKLNCKKTRYAIFPFIRYLLSERPANILSFLPAPNVIATIANLLTLKRSKVIITEHTAYNKIEFYGNQLIDTLIKKIIAIFIYPFADEIIIVSKIAAEGMEKYAGYKKGRVKCIYNPVITPQFFNLMKEEVTHPWFNGEVPVILGVARFHHQKNLPLLINAFADVRKKVNAKLVIIGEGGDAEKLKNLIRVLDIESDVNLVGFQKNPYSYMKQASLFVLSSNFEGLANVLIEAFACGTPVIATDCETGPIEILGNSKYGVLVPVNDKEMMVNAIIECLSNLDKYRKMTLEFQKHEMYKFYSQYSAEQYIKLLASDNNS